MIDPLVPLGDPLGGEDLVRYSRHLALTAVGSDGQRRIRAARVLSIGAGGLGSPAITYLAAAGVGTIGIVDDDVVELSNLQRQIIHGAEDVGRAKVESAADAVRRLNPGIEVRTHPERLTAANAVDIVGQYDVVLDGSDNFATRYLVSDACAVARVPDVWGSILGFEGQVSVFWQDAPGGAGRTYRDLHPSAPEPGAVPSCSEAGVLGSVCGIVGSLMATEALKLITGLGSPLLGRVLIVNTLSMGFREMPFASRGVPVTSIGDEAAETAEPVTPDDRLIDARSLATLLERDAVWLLDVRDDYEAQIVAIPGSRRITAADVIADPSQVPVDRDVVVYCKSGGRSAKVIAALLASGHHAVWHLDGGVLAWIDQIDPSLIRY